MQVRSSTAEPTERKTKREFRSYDVDRMHCCSRLYSSNLHLLTSLYFPPSVKQQIHSLICLRIQDRRFEAVTLELCQIRPRRRSLARGKKCLEHFGSGIATTSESARFCSCYGRDYSTSFTNTSTTRFGTRRARSNGVRETNPAETDNERAV